MTKLNQKILTLIRNSDGHLSAEELFLLAKNNDIDVSLASIYRILKKLSQDGLIRRIPVPGAPDIYDRTLSDHEHMICSVCGKVTDIHVDGLRELLEKNCDTGIEDYSLSIRYICEDCRKQM